MNRNASMKAAACAAALTLWSITASTPVAAAVDCRTSGSFDAWLARFKAEAAAQGISRSAIDAASPYLVYDQRIVNIDRGQRIFAQSFLEFSGKMLPAYRLQQGAAEIKKYAPDLRSRRKAIRRSGGRDHRLLGAGKRFRHQHGQGQLDALPDLARL